MSEELVDHPAHYGGRDDPYEHVKVAEHLGWCGDAMIYNCTKYLWRMGRKTGAPVLRDLEKARWYLDRRIQQLRAEEEVASLTPKLPRIPDPHPVVGSLTDYMGQLFRWCVTPSGVGHWRAEPEGYTPLRD